MDKDILVPEQKELKELLHYDPETGAFTWLVSRGRVKVGAVAGGISGKGYIAIKINQARYYAHRLAWLYVHGHSPPNETDHINGIRTDNRLCNLRLATNSENQMNRKQNINNKSGFKGVSWHRATKKWLATGCLGGTVMQLGAFTNILEAIATREAFAKEHHGEFYSG